MTNYERLRILNKTMDSLTKYSGPIAAMGEGKEGIDDDLWAQLMAFKTALEARIEEVEQTDWDEEAV